MALNNLLITTPTEKFISPSTPNITEVKYETLLTASGSWDGSVYPNYPSCPPVLSVLKIIVPSQTTVAWHRHPIMIVGYLFSGTLIIEKKDTNIRKTFHTGEVIPEVVDTDHRVITGDETVELLVFYVGGDNIPLSILTET